MVWNEWQNIDSNIPGPDWSWGYELDPFPYPYNPANYEDLDNPTSSASESHSFDPLGAIGNCAWRVVTTGPSKEDQEVPEGTVEAYDPYNVEAYDPYNVVAEDTPPQRLRQSASSSSS